MYYVLVGTLNFLKPYIAKDTANLYSRSISLECSAIRALKF